MRIKILLTCLSLFLVLNTFIAFSQGKSGNRTVTITYKLNKIKKMSSNQLAVWIEDTDGNIVKNLFVTRFTGTGGFKKRPQALNIWVEKSDWLNASKQDIDAVSKATQSLGLQTLIWDCRDKKGKNVPNGKYFLIMEGNIYQDNKMLARCEIHIGDTPYQKKADIIFTPEKAKQYGVLFEDVVVKYQI